MQSADQLRILIRDISKDVRRDTRKFKFEEIGNVTEINKSLKVLRKNFSFTKNICETGEWGRPRTILQIGKKFVNWLRTFIQQSYTNKGSTMAGELVSYTKAKSSEDIPDINLDKIRASLKEIKDNKTPGENETVIESI